MKVTATEKKKKHCNVTFENGKTFVISRELVKKYGLEPDCDVDMHEILQKNEEYAYTYALDYAFRLLGISAKTYREMKNKLYDKNIQSSAVNSVMSRLEELGYINDSVYAEDFAEYKMESMLSRRAIVSKLKEKGVAPELIDSAMQKYQESDEYDFALHFATKIAENADSLDYEKLRNKIYSRLSSKGFESKVIFSVLDKIKENYNNSANDTQALSRSAARLYMRGKTREEIYDILIKKNSSTSFGDILNDVLDEFFS